MELSDYAKSILEKRYFLKDEYGKCIEDWDGLCTRVVNAVLKSEEGSSCGIDTLYLKFGTPLQTYDMIHDLIFLPNSPALMNAGKPDGQLSACFVLPIEDSMEGIFDTIKNAAIIHKSGGGTGFNFSKIRPKGSKVKTTGGVASGPLSFLKVFNSATEAVKQGGTRRGANMGILNVDHLDILDWISCKKDTSDITNFNLSIGVTKAFMDAVQNNHNKFTPNHDISAQHIWKLLIERAWLNGEPGIIFLDRVDEFNPTPELGPLDTTNPCGEVPLLPFEACNIGSINLAKIESEEHLRKVVRYAIRFLDCLVDASVYPLPQITEAVRRTRKIGLGVMGFADYLINQGVSYTSGEAVSIAKNLMTIIHDEAMYSSQELGKIKGFAPYYKEFPDTKHYPRRRNCTTTCIAPTGTISIIAGCSSGIEPLFGLVETRHQADMVTTIVNHGFQAILTYNNTPGIQSILEEVEKSGTCQHITGLSQSIKDMFVTAHDISPKQHVEIQAAFQSKTCNAVSKTINLPSSATVKDVDTIFKLAYNLGCKGVTVYRDGTRKDQTIQTTKKESIDSDDSSHPADMVKVSPSSIPSIRTPRERPMETYGVTLKTEIGCGKLYITANSDAEGLCEVFTNNGRGGGCHSQSEAISRLVSLCLRSRVSVESITDQLIGIKCPSTTKVKGLKALSCPDAIGRLLAKIEKSNTIVVLEDVPDSQNMVLCRNCGHSLVHESGCTICRNCGESKCS